MLQVLVHKIVHFIFLQILPGQLTHSVCVSIISNAKHIFGIVVDVSEWHSHQLNFLLRESVPRKLYLFLFCLELIQSFLVEFFLHLLYARLQDFTLRNRRQLLITLRLRAWLWLWYTVIRRVNNLIDRDYRFNFLLFSVWAPHC